MNIDIFKDIKMNEDFKELRDVEIVMKSPLFDVENQDIILPIDDDSNRWTFKYIILLPITVIISPIKYIYSMFN